MGEDALSKDAEMAKQADKWVQLVQPSESSELILVWQPNRFRHPKAP
jgi:hypothetical protein